MFQKGMSAPAYISNWLFHTSTTYLGHDEFNFDSIEERDSLDNK